MGSMTDPAPDMLTRRFGKEVVNYFSGSPLNRLGFLRGDHEFLSAAFSHPTTAILLLDTDLSPLVKSRTTLSYVTAVDVESYTGKRPFTKTEDDMVATYNSEEKSPLVIFLGLDQSQTGQFKYKEYEGQPHFAVHVAGDGAAATMLRTALEGTGSTWLRDARAMSLAPSEAATYAVARHIADWNIRNPFCASCGSATLIVHAGWKRMCPPRDNAPSAASSPDRPACSSRGRISNVCFPRTDPTVIVAVISSDGSKVLLGRQRRWPPDWYSTLAGFVEPGESLEEAVRREVWEESGVTAARVVLHSSQPWPFSGGLMVGALAVAAPGPGENIYLGHDPELEDARWFTMAEVDEALKAGAGGRDDPVKPGRDGKLRVPPATAIAHRLIEAAVTGMGEAGGWKI